MRPAHLLLSLVVVLGLAGCGSEPVATPAQTPSAPIAVPTAAKPAAPVVAWDGRSFPFDHCVTCTAEDGHDHGAEELVTKVHKEREIKLCRGCIKIYTADPDGYVRKVDQAIKQASTPR